MGRIPSVPYQCAGELYVPMLRFSFLATNPCPNLNIVISSLYGSISLVVGTLNGCPLLLFLTEIAGNYTPDQTTYTWLKSYYNQDRIRICNSDPAFNYGYYHVRLYLSPPFIAFGRCVASCESFCHRISLFLKSSLVLVFASVV